MSLAESTVEMCGSSSPLLASQRAAKSLAASISACFSSGVSGVGSRVK